MKIIRTIKDMQAESGHLRQAGNKIGFVPTMGFLHEGHLSLIRIARDKADVVIVSIFVNPTQFGPEEDLDKYPRDFKRDEKLAQDAGADVIFYPTVEEMYPQNYLTYVNVEKITGKLCGTSRPVHFKGVATICAKLFLAVKPDFAVFGQKDAQQVLVIQRMVKDLNFDLDIIVGPIVREEDGLAMSSRNTYLSEDERADALSLNQSLRAAEQMIQDGEQDAAVIKTMIMEKIAKKTHTRIDYISIVDAHTLESTSRINKPILIALAVFVGKIRLIDNTVIRP